MVPSLMHITLLATSLAKQMCIRDSIRGTPVMIQLLIIYYVVLASVTNKILVAVIAFGLNSAAYVAEIVRSGIMSVDIGQFEAGRSLGLNYRQTMKLVKMCIRDSSTPECPFTFTKVSFILSLTDMIQIGRAHV